MQIFMWLLLAFIILQRLVELLIARRNEQWMRERGGIEIGSEHYKWFFIVHSCFFISILLEVSLQTNSVSELNNYLFALFLLTQLARVWCIQSLGRFWNTKIIVLPNVALVKRGPYKYIKHPNYVIVGVELFVIPLLFGAYMTAVLFPLFHLILLKIRIPAEEKALKKVKMGK
ncbi:isoprenylcysteine carboxyl methyltransferase family protein [Oceanobacillus senegalensis]|uniref:isoprenylcysteine carboxyl methyltransferase family protein n=1 Tax=Oceanobacillus senegalensis TaxID=1936063 RepID=UPI000A314158|nr:isoprenylcysteine carboxylmethyltransferase family protein [Oceanobacillus senegalensis]